MKNKIIKGDKKNMKYKHITILTIFISALLLCSLSTISAANNTINDTSTGGIAQGITDTGNEDTLFLQPGIYNKTTDRGITINKNITIQGNGSTDSIVIDAQGLSRIFAISTNMTVTFINITFINGINNGAAIYTTTATMNLINCTFTENKGIMIYTNQNEYSDNYITINNCTFINNAATFIFGGTNLLMTDCKVINGTGGVLSNGGRAEIINCTFMNNNASGYGGALNIATRTYLNIENCSFINNIARGANGAGAIYQNGGGDNRFITNCIFIGNTAIQSAGAMWVGSNTRGFLINNCTFINNTASTGHGGAIHIAGTGHFIVNCTFIENQAETNGGAINIGGTGHFIVNCTFIENQAGSNGGVIRNGGNLTLLNNTMSDNTANLGQMIYNDGNIGVLNLTFIDNSTWIVKNGSTITLYATLVDDMGNTITGQNISFYLNGVFFENVTSIEGYANITLTVPSSPEDITVSGEYAGDGTYNILINNGLLQIRIPTKITISVPKEVKVGDTVTLESKLTDEDGNPLAGKTVDFYVDGVKVGFAVTDSNGIAKLNYIFTKAGKPNVVAKFSGDGTYGPSNATNSTTVYKIKTNLELETNGDTITATLTDEDGNPLANKEVTITVNGKTYTKTTNSKGRVIINYKNAWNYKVTANFAGDSQYLASKATAPKRTVTKLTIKKDGDKITVTLTDENGNPLEGKDIYFRVLGKLIKVGVTNADGQVTFIYNGPTGNLKASFPGDSEYQPSSSSIVISNNNPKAATINNAEMKNTGIPIMSVLVCLLAIFGLVGYKKRE